MEVVLVRDSGAQAKVEMDRQTRDILNASAQPTDAMAIAVIVHKVPIPCPWGQDPALQGSGFLPSFLSFLFH